MKKALLIGKFNTVFKDLYDFLAEKDEFIHIQVCPEHIESVKSIIKMTNPGLIIVSLINLDKEYQSLFAFIRLKYEEIPVLCIGTEAEQRLFDAFLETAQFQTITRPCTNRNIWTHVKAILNISEKPKTDGAKLKAYSDTMTEEELERELEEKIGRRMDKRLEDRRKERSHSGITVKAPLMMIWTIHGLTRHLQNRPRLHIRPKPCRKQNLCKM